MDYPFYTLVLHRGELARIVNVKTPTFDDLQVAELAVFQQSPDKALIVKNRFGARDQGHVVKVASGAPIPGGPFKQGDGCPKCPPGPHGGSYPGPLRPALLRDEPGTLRCVECGLAVPEAPSTAALSTLWSPTPRCGTDVQHGHCPRCGSCDGPFCICYSR